MKCTFIDLKSNEDKADSDEENINVLPTVTAEVAWSVYVDSSDPVVSFSASFPLGSVFVQRIFNICNDVQECNPSL